MSDILYGVKENVPPPNTSTSASNVDKNETSNNVLRSKISKMVKNSKPKTPTKPKQARFDRRGKKIVKTNKANLCSTTMETGKSLSPPKFDMVNDNYSTWFSEQIGWCCEGEAFEGKDEIMELFNLVTTKDTVGLEGGQLSDDACNDFKVFHDIRDDYGNTLLMASAHVGFKRGVKYFIKRGWDVNARNKYGNTAMHFAVERGQYKIAEYLNKKGADLKIVNDMGLTAYERVEQDKRESISEMD